MSPLPVDHAERMARARRSLEGLSVGDAFGQRFFVEPAAAVKLIELRALPRAPWGYTDDTEMALAIYAVLDRYGHVDQDALAAEFARRWRCDPTRGYAGTAMEILEGISDGGDWRAVAGAPYGGTGSMGNGAAMRVAVLGAYFASDDPAVVAREATLSAEVTHAHKEGQAGAVAIALAAQHAWRRSRGQREGSLWEWVLARTPRSETWSAIEAARAFPMEAEARESAEALGSGWSVIAQDTVPYCLWCAARWGDDYEEAMWNTLSGLGDRDTTCAIVGGVVALSCERETLPAEWVEAREGLLFEPVEKDVWRKG